MKKIISMLLIAFVGSFLIGCVPPPNSSVTRQDVGVISGGVLGGLMGSRFGGGNGQIAAIAAGTVAGALIGGSVGKSMDDSDQLRMSRSLENNSVGQPAYWQNAQTGTTYTVTPIKNVTYNGNPYCREYHTVANIGGKRQQVYGTACRKPDGAWQIQDSREV